MIIERLGGIVCLSARITIRVLSRASSDGILSVGAVRTVRRLAGVSNALMAPNTPVDGSNVHDPELARMLKGTELGVWSLGPQTIDFVERFVSEHQPELVVECGSGVSTLALALFLSRLSSEPTVRLIALEQDEAYADATRRLLRAHGLGDWAVVVYAPLVNDLIEDREAIRYSIPLEFRTAIGERRADLVLIDGPVADTGGRFATLPILIPFVHRARFLMDDAVRDSELSIAADWSRLPFVKVEGIKPIEKGLLIGTVGDLE